MLASGMKWKKTSGSVHNECGEGRRRTKTEQEQLMRGAWCKEFEQTLKERDMRWEELIQHREEVMRRYQIYSKSTEGRLKKKEEGIRFLNQEMASYDCAKRIIWGIWKAASRYSGIEKKKDDMRKKWQWKANEDKTERLRAAHEEHDYREVWAVARRIWGMHVGKGKIKLRVPKSCDPSIEEWVEAMGKDGPSGGYLAIERRRGRGEKDKHEGRVLIESAGRIERTARETEAIVTREELLKLLKRAKNMKAAPEGRIAKELWQETVRNIPEVCDEVLLVLN
jgi:hypothetical protein